MKIQLNSFAFFAFAFILNIGCAKSNDNQSTSAPVAPSSLTLTYDSSIASNLSSGIPIILKWDDNSTNELGFKIVATSVYLTDGTSLPKVILGTATKNQNSATVYIPNHKNYSYSITVVAFNSNGESSVSNSVSFTTN